MASSGERRLLFDTRGKRKHVIRVVYAILALLMGASLFLVTGTLNIGELVGNSSGGSSAAKVFDEQVERVEGRLVREPDNPQLLLTLTRARISAGNAKREGGSETEPATLTPEARADYAAAAEAWHRYLKQAGDEPSASAAQLVANTYFGVVEVGETLPEIEEAIKNSIAAQRIVAKQRPSLGSLSGLAIYQYVGGDFAAGDKTAKQAEARAGGKAEAKSIEEQLAEYRKKAVLFDKQRKEIVKAERKSGKESLQSPFGGLGGSSLGE